MKTTRPTAYRRESRRFRAKWWFDQMRREIAEVGKSPIEKRAELDPVIKAEVDKGEWD
jgi:hypothetical protein